jgi:hypothetical protein
MTDKIFASYDFDSGTAAARPATPTVSDGRLYIYVATDTGTISIWDGAAWQSFSSTRASLLGFAATRSTNQSVTDAVTTKVVFDSVSLDTASAYNSSTGIYTPTTAGYYLIASQCQGIVATALTDVTIWISKNGTHGSGGTDVSVAQYGPISSGSTSGDVGPIVGFTHMNGSTDTLEIDCRVRGTGGSDVVGSGSTFFAFLVGT